MEVEKHTPGQLAYEADVRGEPFYHDGTARPGWNLLSDLARWSWDRNPTARGQAAKAEARP